MDNVLAMELDPRGASDVVHKEGSLLCPARLHEERRTMYEGEGLRLEIGPHPVRAQFEMQKKTEERERYHDTDREGKLRQRPLEQTTLPHNLVS